MRLAVVGCALAIVVFLSVFGVVVAHRFSAPAVPSPSAIAASERAPDPVNTGSITTTAAGPVVVTAPGKSAATPVALSPAPTMPNAAPAPSAAPARNAVVTPGAPPACPYPDALGVAR